MLSFACTCDWIVPCESPAISNGWLVIHNNCIEFLGQDLPAQFNSLPKIHLGSGAILPGLINAHTHFEFSDLNSPIPVPANGSIVDWLAAVIKHRRALAAALPDHPTELRRQTYLRGVQEAYHTGTRFVIDNVTAPWDSNWISQANAELGPIGITVVPAFELVDVSEKRARETWDFAQQCLSEWPTNPQNKLLHRQTYCLAPHAPYTASTQIIAQAVRFAHENNSWISMHLAESTEELLWTQQRSGPFEPWISPYLEDSHRSHIGTIQDILRQLANAPKTILAHGNYLNKSDIEILKQSPKTFATVYCPRTHRHFGHATYPWNELQQAGIPVLLGTDSRASTPDLSIFKEWQSACASLPTVSPLHLLASCTTTPRNFLNPGDHYGKLAVGITPALTWVPFHATFTSNPAQSNADPQSPTSLWQPLLNAIDSYPLELHPFLKQYW